MQDKCLAFFKKAGFLLFFGLSFLALGHLGSSPYRFLEDVEFSGYKDTKFALLKHRVFKYLQGTWCPEKKAELMMDLVLATRPQVCVEVGACSGFSVLPIAATLRYIGDGHIYAIDAYSNEEAIKNIDCKDEVCQWWKQVDMRGLEQQFKELLNRWSLNSCCSLIHMSSELAAKKVPEIDFLHLDGNFSEEGSLLDVKLFVPKVRAGGYILLSNLFLSVNNKFPKMASMWQLFDECEVVYEVDHNTVLFRKN